MSYQSKNLSVMAYANGYTQWHYTTEDQLAQVVAPDYFNGAADMLRRGDMLIVNAGEASQELGLLFVTGNSMGHVTTAGLMMGVATTLGYACGNVYHPVTTTPLHEARHEMVLGPAAPNCGPYNEDDHHVG